MVVCVAVGGRTGCQSIEFLPSSPCAGSKHLEAMILGFLRHTGCLLLLHTLGHLFRVLHMLLCMFHRAPTWLHMRLCMLHVDAAWLGLLVLPRLLGQMGTNWHRIFHFRGDARIELFHLASCFPHSKHCQFHCVTLLTRRLLLYGALVSAMTPTSLMRHVLLC